jgi:ribosomal protein S18 acetylase RimI-like enzyme
MRTDLLQLSDVPMSITTELRIVPAAVEHVESFHACLDSVARERSGLAITAAFPLDQLRAFVAKNIEEGMPAFFALDGDRVVGWSDIRREERPDVRHRGVLGMGVHRDYRGHGTGRSLLQTALAKAKEIGLIRVDLTVYAQNAAAIALYRRCGFVEEGRIVKGRYLDGRFDDVIQMGQIFSENLPRLESRL